VNIERANILLQISTPFGSGNGNDVVPLGQHPGERELSGRAALFCGKDIACGLSIHAWQFNLRI
jgi:hypothetical protein